MQRREFLKTAAIAGSGITLPFMFGCKKNPNNPPLVDAIISGLKVADSVALALSPIVQPVSPAMAVLLKTVSTDIELVIKTYNDYETGAGSDPTKADLIRATGAAIQGNLDALLTAVGVKNAALTVIVKTGVAIVNSAIIAVLGSLAGATLARAATISTLPTIQGDNSPAGLKKAWNDAVGMEYPSSKI